MGQGCKQVCLLGRGSRCSEVSRQSHCCVCASLPLHFPWFALHWVPAEVRWRGEGPTGSTTSLLLSATAWAFGLCRTQ